MSNKRMTYVPSQNIINVTAIMPKVTLRANLRLMLPESPSVNEMKVDSTKNGVSRKKKLR